MKKHLIITAGKKKYDVVYRDGLFNGEPDTDLEIKEEDGKPLVDTVVEEEIFKRVLSLDYDLLKMMRNGTVLPLKVGPHG